MAETAGLVIGGIGLLSLFDSCMSAFEYVDSGRQYGKDYNKAALRISLLRLRLSRWKQTVDIRESLDGISNKVQVATPGEVERVKELLGFIEEDFRTAQEKSKRYQLKNPSPPDNSPEAQTIDAMSNRMRNMAISRQKSGNLGQKAKWALHDKGKFAELVQDLGENINNLVELFPVTQAQQQQLAVRDATEIIEPAGIEEPDAAPPLLRDASQGVDPQLAAAVQQLASANANGYQFRRMGLDGRAKAQYGTYFAPGEQVRDHNANSTYEDIFARGDTRAHYGTNVGGNYVLDDDNQPPFHQQVHGDAMAGAQRPGQQRQGYGGRVGFPGDDRGGRR